MWGIVSRYHVEYSQSILNRSHAMYKSIEAEIMHKNHKKDGHHHIENRKQDTTKCSIGNTCQQHHDMPRLQHANIGHFTEDIVTSYILYGRMDTLNMLSVDIICKTTCHNI